MFFGGISVIYKNKNFIFDHFCLGILHLKLAGLYTLVDGWMWSDWMYGKLENLGGNLQEAAYAVSNEMAECPTGVKNWHYSSIISNDDGCKIFTKIECVCKYTFVIFM